MIDSPIPTPVEESATVTSNREPFQQRTTLKLKYPENDQPQNVLGLSSKQRFPDYLHVNPLLNNERSLSKYSKDREPPGFTNETKNG